MTTVGQNSNYQKGDVLTYQGRKGQVVENSSNGFVTVRFADGQEMSIKISSLSSLWDISSQLESLNTKIEEKEGLQNLCIDSYYAQSASIKTTKDEMQGVLKGMDFSELSKDMQDVYNNLMLKLQDAKSARRHFSSMIQRNAHSLVSMILERGELQNFAILFGNNK